MGWKPALPTLVLALGVVCPPGGVRGAAAQEASADSLAALTVPELLERGQLLHDQLLPLDALQRFEAVIARDSLHYEARWKAAREAVNVGMLSEDDRRKQWYTRAEEHARAALRAVESRGRPATRGSSGAPAQQEGQEGIDALHWLSVALGRRTMLEGIRTRVRLADEVRRLAGEVLALDSLHPGAHHVLGRWHAEVRRLSGVERWVADRILGGERLDEASWGQARSHLERAVELEPGSLLHRLELARILLDLDEDALARRQLEKILVLPAAEPTDPLHKEEAQELLREIG